jgi:hypothetical protein
MFSRFVYSLITRIAILTTLVLGTAQAMPQGPQLFPSSFPVLKTTLVSILALSSPVSAGTLALDQAMPQGHSFVSSSFPVLKTALVSILALSSPVSAGPIFRSGDLSEYWSGSQQLTIKMASRYKEEVRILCDQSRMNGQDCFADTPCYSVLSNSLVAYTPLDLCVRGLKLNQFTIASPICAEARGLGWLESEIKDFVAKCSEININEVVKKTVSKRLKRRSISPSLSTKFEESINAKGVCFVTQQDLLALPVFGGVPMDPLVMPCGNAYGLTKCAITGSLPVGISKTIFDIAYACYRMPSDPSQNPCTMVSTVDKKFIPDFLVGTMGSEIGTPRKDRGPYFTRDENARGFKSCWVHSNTPRQSFEISIGVVGIFKGTTKKNCPLASSPGCSVADPFPFLAEAQGCFKYDGGGRPMKDYAVLFDETVANFGEQPFGTTIGTIQGDISVTKCLIQCKAIGRMYAGLFQNAAWYLSI